MKKTCLLLSFFSLFVLTACQDVNPMDKYLQDLLKHNIEKASSVIEFQSEGDGEPGEVPSVSCDSKGGEFTVHFKTSQVWEAAVVAPTNADDFSWVTLSRSRGEAGEVSLVITLKENTSYDTRRAVVRIKSGEALCEIDIFQDQVDVILVEENEFNVPAEGGNPVIVLKTNIDFEVDIPAESARWISVEPYTKALNTKYVELIVAGNDGAERSGKVYVVNKKSGISAVVTINQEAGWIEVTDVRLDQTEPTIIVGDADVKLTATVAPENATDKTVSWASDNAEVATVDQEGNVHAVAEGTATITVTTTDGGKTATCAVTVKAATVSVTEVTLDMESLEITVGDPDVKLTATVSPDNATDKTVSWTSDNTDVANVDQEGNVQAVAPGEAIITVTTTDGGKTATCAVTVKEVLSTDALSGEFSVSANKKVRFSRGNLVATINASGTPTAWNFAAHQYDCLGENGANKTIGTSAGDIDLFGWSTASTTYGISTSTSWGDYSGDFVDWGKNMGDGNTWRTLSEDEWTYLFNTTSRMVNSKPCYSNAVNGVIIGGTSYKGVFIYPDNYNGNEVSSSMTWNQINAAGIVFLPAAGCRYGSNVDSDNNVGNYGYYWSSTDYNGDFARNVKFHSSEVYPRNSEYRNNGFSVRLVTEVPAAGSKIESFNMKDEDSSNWN